MGARDCREGRFLRGALGGRERDHGCCDGSRGGVGGDGGRGLGWKLAIIIRGLEVLAGVKGASLLHAPAT